MFSCIATILPRRLLFAVSETHTGMVEVFIPDSPDVSKTISALMGIDIVHTISNAGYDTANDELSRPMDCCLNDRAYNHDCASDPDGSSSPQLISENGCSETANETTNVIHCDNCPDIAWCRIA
jgi:hypothetical protein